MGRTAMVYAPMILCYILFLFQRFNSYPKGEYLHLGLNLLIVGLLAWNFRFVNLKESVVWTYDAAHKEMLKDLEQTAAQEQDSFQLGVNWLFEPALNVYRESKDIGWLEELNRNGYQDKSYDAYYLLSYKEKDIPMIQKLKAAESGYTLISEYENGAMLFVNERYL